jgi:hypothetical protein
MFVPLCTYGFDILYGAHLCLWEPKPLDHIPQDAVCDVTSCLPRGCLPQTETANVAQRFTPFPRQHAAFSVSPTAGGVLVTENAFDRVFWRAGLCIISSLKGQTIAGQIE